MKTPLLALTTVGISFFASQLNARPEGAPQRPDPEAIVVEMFADYDADENDLLNQEELTAALAGIREKHQAERGDRPSMGRERSEGATADRPEKSGNGKRKGPPSPEDAAARMIADFDTSGDASLDTAETLEALKNMPQRGRGGRKGREAPADAE